MEFLHFCVSICKCISNLHNFFYHCLFPSQYVVSYTPYLYLQLYTNVLLNLPYICPYTASFNSSKSKKTDFLGISGNYTGFPSKFSHGRMIISIDSRSQHYGFEHIFGLCIHLNPYRTMWDTVLNTGLWLNRGFLSLSVNFPEFRRIFCFKRKIVEVLEASAGRSHNQRCL